MNNWNGAWPPSIGQMGIVPCYPNPVKIVHVGKNEIAFDSGDDGLDICKTYEFKPIPNMAETAKQKAIDEMLSIHCDDINEWMGEYQDSVKQYTIDLYDNGYTKSKVKPLPEDFITLYHNNLDIHKLGLNEWLIENGYCIASAD
jgi:hypothetical protein